MIQEVIHKKIVENCDEVHAWFEKTSRDLAFPFYTSYDIRDSGQKLAPVDANIYPAGFNNICPTDKEHAPAIVKKYLESHYGLKSGPIGLVTEEHSNNPFYWQNVTAIKSILTSAGYEVLLALPKEFSGPIEMTNVVGEKLSVYSAHRDQGRVLINGISPALIISNNDFSDPYETWAEGLQTPINPPREFGWYRRKKHIFFETYNQLCDDFSKVIQFDPFWIKVETELVSHFDVADERSREDLAFRVDAFLSKLKAKYQEMGIKDEPFAFVKNNAGTYGLAVIQVKSGDEVRSWNYKSKKKMKAAKGGRDVEEVIIQEGIPTRLKEGAETAEPCIYMVGCQLVGGFLRAHAEKGPEESLNSPGAVYRKLCMSDLEVKQSECPKENVYGWLSKLGVLSAAVEARRIGVEFKGYKGPGCTG